MTRLRLVLLVEIGLATGGAVAIDGKIRSVAAARKDWGRFVENESFFADVEKPPSSTDVGGFDEIGEHPINQISEKLATK